ncbi:MAG: DUF2066 domain-containing protein [Proteobacteria bacterium]|nr:DUF2066 domain-containing protein [Pseudomonadota bacterium]
MTDTKLKLMTMALGSLMLSIFLLVLSTNSVLAAANPYLIRGISVDETATSIPQAKKIAVQNGQRRAFNTLLRRLVPNSYDGELPVLDDDTLTSMVTSYRVANERTAAQRYLADLSFEFSRADIRSLLRNWNLPFSEAAGKPLLILPVYDDGNRRFLWEEPNPWRTQWVDVIDYNIRPQEPEAVKDYWSQELMQPVIVPAGDFTDVKTINVEEAISLDKAALTEIEKIYGASGTAVVRASFREDRDGSLILDISRQRSDRFRSSVIESYKGSDDPDLLMQSAIFDLLEKMQEEWKSENIIDFSIENTVAVTTSVSDLQSWLSIQEKVRNLPSVSGTRVKDLSVSQAFWHITFLGDIQQLSASLAQENLRLVDNDGYWTLNQTP